MVILMFCSSYAFSQPQGQEEEPVTKAAAPQVEVKKQGLPKVLPSNTPPLHPALEEIKKKLGELEPWQQTLFTDEVVPHFQKNANKVDLNYQTLKSILAFGASKFLGKKDAKILVLLKPDTTCRSCVQSVPRMTQMLQARLQRRELSPVWVGSEEIANTSIKLEDQLVSLAQQRQAVGVFILSWGPVAAEDNDTASSDEDRFKVHTFLNIIGIPAQSREKEIVDSGDLEFSLGSALEEAVAVALLEIFRDIGLQMETGNLRKPSGGSEEGKVELWVEIAGIRDFAQYQRIKNILQTQLKEVSLVEDRKFSKEKIVFAVFTKNSVQDLKKQIEALSLTAEGEMSLTIEVKDGGSLGGSKG